MSKIDWRQNIIRDGVTQDGYIAEREGLHGELKFEYRPMLGQVADKLAKELEKTNATNAEQSQPMLAKHLAKYIVSWSEGPVEVESLRCMRSVLFWTLYNILVGNRASDPLPDKTTESDDADELLGKS